MKVICCGNATRGDDAAALLVAARLHDLGIEADVHQGGALELLERWDASDEVILVDAMLAVNRTGTVHCWTNQLPSSIPSGTFSGHTLGIIEALELADVLGHIPRSLQIYGIEGRRFGRGEAVSPEVLEGVAEVVSRVAAKVAATASTIHTSVL